MWFARFITPLLFCCLTACAFQPLYNADESTQELETIKIALIKDRLGQQLRNHLISTLTPYGQPQKPTYDLSVTVTESERAFAIRRDATIDRKEIVVTLSYILTDHASRKPLKTGTLSIASSFAELSNTFYANITARDSAKKALMQNLAMMLKADLAAYFKSTTK